MKAVILAGGFGTRISEETEQKPKPMVPIGGKPILWHIMKIYSTFGINDFIICCGYQGYVIKEYFLNYYLHVSDVTFDLKKNSTKIHQNSAEPWTVTLVDTGERTATGGRLKRVREYLDEEDFCFTYGDGVSDVDIGKLIAHHKAAGKLATVTAVQPPIKYGVFAFDGDRITAFNEKPEGEGGWINGGFFILSADILDLIDGDDVMWEHAPMQKLIQKDNLAIYNHTGFWHAMDTLRDKNQLESLWQSGKAPWKTW